ncbi:hypothetical protein [Bacillus thuringiensis]|uniref:Uncharacterized protein n=1 Tax=Bacillus thuringiensis TaxID=1428 RepID=A0A9X6VE72_BACTU|nr:hypothetical protein [Bacillus thuringiensis]PFB09054.1 hypothetical protein CN398_05290 [Bacillus thuringiensis]
MDKEMLELIREFNMKYNQLKDKSFLTIHEIAKETIFKGIDTSLHSFSEESYRQMLQRYIPASNYLLQQEDDNARYMRKSLHAVYSYYKNLNPVMKTVNGKRLYGNKFKTFTIRQTETEIKKVFATKMTAEKFEHVLMFIEAVVGKELDLYQISFYAGLFFDIYEIQDNELRVFGEENLIDFDFDNLGTGYGTHIEAIRSRYGNHKSLLLQSDLLWKEMYLADRLPRLIHFHEDNFDLITEAETTEDGHFVLEQLYQCSDVFLNNSQLLLTISIFVKHIETPNGSYIGSDCTLNIMTAPYTFELRLERPKETPSELFFNRDRNEEFTIEDILRPYYAEDLVAKQKQGA